MPCTFDASVVDRADGASWRSMDMNLRTSSNEHFVIRLHNVGGVCGHCRDVQEGTIWGSQHYVLCVQCATDHFAAPDIRRMYPDLFEDEDASYEDGPTKLATKKDKDFDPRHYSTYMYGNELSGRHGCQGYRCETYAAPMRTIPANTTFMMGVGNRGHLCMACFNKLKVKFDALPARVMCACCDRRVVAERMVRTVPCSDMPYTQVCQSCATEHYVHCPETDNAYVYRQSTVWAMYPPTSLPGTERRVYASITWATGRWFRGRDRWYASQAEWEREMYRVDTAYLTERLTGHERHIIFSYGTNVVRMHGFPSETKPDDLCFGVELEMQSNRTSNINKVVEVLGGKYVASRPFILCADSSIGSNGVELITLPYTLDGHKSNKFMQWDKVLESLRPIAQSGMNTTACGMHVHINRRALTRLQMGKMLVAINAPEMQELVVTIAQRSETSYANRYYKKVTEGGKIIGSHGDALNMSNHKGTVELRIFRGNLRYERVMKNLEFAEALCLYSLEQSIQKVNIPSEMVSWINDNRGRYPNLVKFIAEEYQPTKAFARSAAKYRANQEWGQAAAHVNIEAVEGDI